MGHRAFGGSDRGVILIENGEFASLVNRSVGNGKYIGSDLALDLTVYDRRLAEEGIVLLGTRAVDNIDCVRVELGHL